MVEKKSHHPDCTKSYEHKQADEFSAYAYTV